MSEVNFLMLNITNPAHLWVIGLHLQTREACERGIRWQNIGQGAWDKWEIADSKRIRQLLDDGNLDRGCFTVEAWAKFETMIREKTNLV